MSSIKIFSDIYNQKGENFVRKLLALEITVTEKLAGNTFSFKYDGEFTFFKRNTDSPITKIDRTIMVYYEDAINYILNLPQAIVKKIPNNWKFCFEYFPNISPNNIIYDKLPLNKLVLTHIISDNIIDDKESLDKWAELLKVSPPPIIFQGYLSEEQKDKLLEYIHLTKEEILKKFNNISFTKFILSILNPNLKNRLLSSDLSKPIDSIIFTFENIEKKYLAKLIDPGFEYMISQNKIEEEKNDIISIIYADIIEFMLIEEKKWKNYKFEKESFDDKYIELISEMYNTFIEKYGYKYRDLYDEIPSFMKKKEFDININFINNEKTKKIINYSSINKELLKLFLVLFRKKKKNPEEFITPTLLNYQNNLVEDIFDKINDSSNKSATYEQFISMLNLDEEKEKTLDINEAVQYNNLDAMKIVSFWQEAFDFKEPSFSIPKKDVNIAIGNFQPMHKGIYEQITKIYEKTKIPFILIQVCNKNQTNNRPVSKLTSYKILYELVKNEEKKFLDIIQVDSLEFKFILNILNNKKYNINYNINKILCSSNVAKDLMLQMKYISFEKESYLNPKIKLIEYDKYEINSQEINSHIIIKTILENDYFLFKRMVPEVLWSSFEKIKQDVYLFLNNFKEF